MTRIIPRKDDYVFVVNHDAYEGFNGTVVEIFTKKLDVDTRVRMVKVLDDTNLSRTVKLSQVKLANLLTLSERQALLDKHAQLTAEAEARQAERERIRRLEAIAKIVEARKADAGLRVTWTERERNTWDGKTRVEIAYDPWTLEHPGRNLVEVTEDAGAWGSPFGRVEVSWSSPGAVSPEKALAMGQALIAAAHKAMELRRKLEEQHEDLMQALGSSERTHAGVYVPGAS